jgi:hypothetical protein
MAKGAEMKAHQVTGQCAEVLTLIRQHQPLLSFVLTADHALAGSISKELFELKDRADREGKA